MMDKKDKLIALECCGIEYVQYSVYAALEQRVKELEAENAQLKRLLNLDRPIDLIKAIKKFNI